LSSLTFGRALWLYGVVRYFAGFLIVLGLQQPSLYSYSVLTHEAIIDTSWKDSIQPLLLRRFPGATPDELKSARAYAYGGSIVQDMGYYPFGSHFFTDLTHYVRSGDFVAAMLHDASTLDEYAFAIGALAHYASDTTGHPLAINRAVPMLYPKLGRKYGPEVTYADDPSSHVKTEFGFDVLQVAKGRYASDAYHDFIGFEVAKPLIERVFLQIYGLDLKDVFNDLDMSIGTYRKTVSGVIPKITRVAWVIKQGEIEKSQPGITREKFLYQLSRADYAKAWGTSYKEPGIGSRMLAFVIRIIPKIGPFQALAFRTPTPQTEKLFMDSFNATLDRYRSLLAAEQTRRIQPADLNLDVGQPTTAGAYRIADEAYARLVDELGKQGYARVSRELRENILSFYKDGIVPASAKIKEKDRLKLARQLEQLKQTNPTLEPASRK
jgi:hypothetical protein